MSDLTLILKAYLCDIAVVKIMILANSVSVGHEGTNRQ